MSKNKRFIIATPADKYAPVKLSIPTESAVQLSAPESAQEAPAVTTPPKAAKKAANKRSQRKA